MISPLGRMKYALVFLLVILAANLLIAQELLKQHVENPSNAPMDQRATGHNPEAASEQIEQAKPTGQTVVTGNGINYHGGPVLKGNPVPLYIIWYGNWSGTGSNTAATVSLVEHFINTLGNTPYEDIATTYGDNTGNVSGNVTLGGAIFDTGSQGTRLSNSKLSSIVTRSFSNGLPKDANGVYLVLTSSNVSEQGFCSQFCGFHTAQTLSGTDIKWAFIGNPDRCPSGCEIQTTGPNSPATGVGGADGMINVITHEQFEAITDPDLNAWFDSSGEEDSDKCNFNFGATSTCNANGLCTPAGTSAGAKYNQTFGNNNWMMQQNWENANGGACVQHL
jgi:Phosphate-induced protein 1 conserved region